jgi:PAS domain S-box-containing protein
MNLPGFSSLNVRTQLALLISLMILIISGLFYALTRTNQKEILSENFRRDTEVTLKYVQFGLQYGLEEQNYYMTEEVFKWVKHDEKVLFIGLFDEDKELFASYPEHIDYKYEVLKELSGNYDLDEPLVVLQSKFTTNMGESTIFIGFSTESLREIEAKTFRQVTTRTAVTLLLGIILAFVFSRSITRSLVNLSQTAKKIAEGDLTLRAEEKKGGKEIRELAKTFNRMLQKIIESQEELFREMTRYNTSLDEQNKVLKQANDTMQKEIAERKRAEEALQHSEQLMRVIIDTAPAMIMYLDEDNNIQLVNQWYAREHDLESEEITGRKIDQLEAAEDIRIYKKNLEEARRQRSIVSFQNNIRPPEGEQKVFYMAMSPNFSADGEFYGTVLIAIDITDQKKAELALRESEERFRLLTENSTDHIMEISGQEIVYANKTYYDFFDIDDPESHADPFYGIHPDDRCQFVDILREHAGRWHTVSAVFRAKGKPGEWRWFETKGNFYLTADGEKHAVFVSRDITESKKAEEAIRESEEKFRTLTESAQDGIIIMDNNGLVSFWNEAAERIFGYSRSEARGKDVHRLIAPERIYEDYRKGFDRFRITGEGRVVGKTLELMAINKEKNEFPLELSLSAVKVNGKWHAIGIARDIGERKKMEEDLKNAKAAAETANRAKSEFLANMSHEIRTPMNAILGFSQLLSERVSDPQKKSYVDSITSSGKSLLSLINDILDLSKIESGRLELEFEAVNPYTIFKEIKNIFNFRAKEKGLEFITEIDDEFPKGLVLDEIRLRQILVNLVGNALKFTDKGYIRIAARKEFPDEDHSRLNLIFSVEDTGVGIPKGQQEMIFESFRQQSGQSSRKYGGTGLGLAITRRLVEMMNGFITVESTPGEGTKFEVRLRNVAVSSTVEPEETEAGIQKSEVHFEGATIMVVDDIALNRKLISEFLSQSDINIIEAENGKDALEKLKENQIDLIIMDMKMPVMSGYQATEFIRTQSKWDDVPIIALTASAMKGDEERIKKVGCNGYQSKPVEKLALMQEIAKFLKDKIISKEKEEPESEVAENVEYTEDKLKNPHQLIDKLEGELMERKNKLASGLIIGEVNKFAAAVKQIAEEHNSNTIKRYGDKLARQADNFDLPGLKKSIDDFDEITRIIKQYIPE